MLAACGIAPPAGPLIGADISWAQCTAEPMPLPGISFTIIQLTGGRGFTKSACLAQEIRWARAHHQLVGVYEVPNFPNRTQLAEYGNSGPYGNPNLLARVSNTGYKEALMNIATLRASGLGNVRTIWIDVETETITPWSSNPALNQAVLLAEMRAYNTAGYRVGFYSYAVWQTITGGWRGSAPVWATSGHVDYGTALWRCGQPSFSGGPTMFSQWNDGHRDHDLSCPYADIYSALIQL